MDKNDKYKEFVRSVPNSECEFQYIELRNGFLFTEDGKEKTYQLLFLLKGGIKVTYGENTAKEIGAKEFFLLSKDNRCSVRACADSIVLVMHFKKVNHTWNSKKIGNLLDAYPHSAETDFPSLKIKPLLQAFLDLLTVYIKERNIEKSFFTWKDEELLSLLYAIYAPKELSRLFFPVLRSDADFKSFVMANYLKAESAAGLAELAGCSLVTLNRKFKKYFNDSAYQWMMRNRIIKIRERLKNSDIPLGEIAKEFGFHSSTELNRFCLRQLGMSARKMRME